MWYINSTQLWNGYITQAKTVTFVPRPKMKRDAWVKCCQASLFIFGRQTDVMALADESSIRTFFCKQYLRQSDTWDHEETIVFDRADRYFLFMAYLVWTTFRWLLQRWHFCVFLNKARWWSVCHYLTAKSWINLFFSSLIFPVPPFPGFAEPNLDVKQ